MIQIHNDHGARVARSPFWQHLYFQVLVAITLGALIGHFWPETGESLKPLGDGFIKLVKMVIAPVIFLTIVIGIAGMRDIGRVGRVAAKAFGYFFVFSTLALIIGLTVANVVRPGDGLNIDPATLDSGAVAQYAEAAHESTITGFLMGIIPDSLVGAFTSGSILQVLFIALLVGFALQRMGERGARMVDAIRNFQVLVFRILGMILWLAPIGAFGASAAVVGKTGFGAVISLGILMGAFYLTCFLFIAVFKTALNVSFLGLIGQRWDHAFVAGMVLSQIVAFVVAPWLAFRLLKHKKGEQAAEAEEASSSADGVSPLSLRIFRTVLGPFLGDHPWRRRLLALGVVGLTLAATSLPVFQAVILKMLPFDNKSELQVVVDMPERTPMEQTQRVLMEMGSYLETVDEVANWQTYAGTASPINFNGLVRQYYLRGEPYHGDIQVNLIHEENRNRQSHDIAQSLRDPLTEIGERYGASVKIVEVPPGPPVLSPVVAEIYAVDEDRRAALARQVAEGMTRVDGLVDIDTTLESPTRQWEVVVDRDRAARLGVSQAQVVAALQTALGGTNVSFLHDDHAKYPVPIRVILGEGDKAQPSVLLSLKVRSRSGALVPLASIADVREADWMGAIYHKDLLPVTYVTADMAGEIDSPLYGMFAMVERLNQQAGAPEQYFIDQPPLPEKGTLKWDGEWQITYETFRDMGAAYSVGVFMIFVLLVAQFRYYILPLVIMAPIPLTLIGIMPGHALLGREFTATSMIGMIALAGIIVRNSILLVVFIRQLIEEGVELDEAVVLAGAVRIKPIALTAISAMVGAYFILNDPIFNGLAISLVFGLAMSTLLTVLVVPLLYYTLARCKWV